MTVLLLETLAWSFGLTVFAVSSGPGWGTFAYAAGLALCLLRAPGKAIEEEAEAALRARLDAEWDELFRIGGRS